jgi:hypothetical protein
MNRLAIEFCFIRIHIKSNIFSCLRISVFLKDSIFSRERELDSRLVVQMNGNQVVLTAANVKDPNSTLGGDRTKNNKFTFDYAYWSHDKNDHNFADQVSVRCLFINFLTK